MPLQRYILRHLTPKPIATLTSIIAFCGALSACDIKDEPVSQPTSKSISSVQLAPLEQHSSVARDIMIKLLRGHYTPQRLDDELSSQILDGYIDRLDSSRSYFTQADIDDFEAYRYQFDEDLARGELGPAFAIYNRYLQRTQERFEFLLDELAGPIDGYRFDKKERLEIDREQAPWADDEKALNTLWKKRLKNAYLNLLNADKDHDDIKKVLVKRYANQKNRLQQSKSEDGFQAFMNAVTETFDPHTQYFSPRNSENFNINMSLSLQGIGAVLQTEDEHTKVVRLVPAGPADKMGQLKPADKIVAVGQGKKGEMVDVVGWRLDEVVDLIRGEKGSTVRLDIIPHDSDGNKIVNIAIVRDEVKLEEQSAHSSIMPIKQGDKVVKLGVITIPTFYIDFQGRQARDPNYKSTTRDVRKLISNLKDEGIDGLLIDLRNNGGGSLEEAINLTGLFISRGPVVQVRSARGNVDVLEDRDPTRLYNGPLAVVVNRLSASASEIFAGAIQDYGRGLIIGGQTFGKGTVQTLLPVGSGQLKVTQAKFYRISGESTQNQGVIPDVSLPSLFDKDKIGESSLDKALPWDTIKPADYLRQYNYKPYLQDLVDHHQKRTQDDPDFIYLQEQKNMLSRLREQTSVSLNKKQRQHEREKNDKQRLNIENKRRAAKKEPLLKKLDDLDSEDDKDKKPEDDAILLESGTILLDWLQQKYAVLNTNG